MQVTGKNGIGSFLKIFLQTCFYCGIIILIILPFALSLVGLNLNASAVVIYPNGIALLFIMYKFIKLFDSLKQNNPFCEENIKILRDTAKISLVEASLWTIDLLIEFLLVKSTDIIILLTLVFLAVLFVGVAIALYILSELFKEAVKYKKENELTI